LKYILVRAEPCAKDKRESILAIEFQPYSWERFWGARAHVREYHGGSTVWRELPKLVRVGTLMESYLSDCEKWWEYRHNRKSWRYGE
jgi:hypothetical protein